MCFFCVGDGRARQVRLSFSSVEPDVIREGVRRFARFVRDQEYASNGGVKRTAILTAKSH
jgi:DNA-binding transcriptional MocR family regulator